MKVRCVVGVWFVASAVAQDVATIGSFVDLDGRPVARATVTFATSPPDLFDHLAPPHVVEASTDDAGRFRVLLRPGTAYSAWAIGPAGDGGRWRSVVHEGVVPGNVVPLRAAQRSTMPPLRVDGLAHFGDGTFTAEVRPAAMHAPIHRIPLPAAGTAVLPELPAGQIVARLLGAEGRLAVGSLSLWSGVAHIEAVKRQVVEVVDEHGAPVAGARVGALVSTFLARSPLQFGARQWSGVIEGPPTDADGRSTLLLAEWPEAFVARAGERHARVARLGNQPIVDGVLTAARGEPAALGTPVRLVVRDGPALRGTLRRGATPLAQAGVVAVVEICCETKEGGGRTRTWFSSVERTATTAEGAFVFAGLPRPIGSLQLCVDAGDAVPVLVLARRDVPAAPLEIDLDEMPLATLRLHADGAVPPATVRFLLWPGDAELDHVEPVVLVGDRSGTARARLEPGSWFLVATDGDSFAAEVVTVRGREPLAWRPQLAPLARMRGLVVDATGRPVAGATFAPGGFGATNADTSTTLGQLLYVHFSTINSGLIPAATSDAEGRFEVRLLDVRGCTMSGMVTGFPGSTWIEFRPADDVEIQLGRK